ncbi:hypothetical protein FXO38_00072 [Capsicum annuum]|nr:hypothetical protein FXO38_00072 [Capsicum annuum]
MAWRVQNHNMSLSPPNGNNSLFLTIDPTYKAIEYTKILRKISRDELVSITPASWVTTYDKLRAHSQTISSNDDSDHHYLKRPPKTTFYIPEYNPNDDLSDVKDPDTTLKFLTGFMRQHDWIKNFNNKGCSLMWRKCPFSGHYPWKADCDCKICRRRAAAATQPEMLLTPLSTSSHIDSCPSNHRYKEIT